MKELFINKEPKSPTAEAYRTLRTNLQFSSVDKDIKSIVVTSSGASEGKSTTASNIAASFVQMGKKVIILDCDFRKPRIHKIFGISNRSGMTNIISEKTTPSDYVTKFDNLYVLPSGPIPPNPSEMLGSERMKSIIKELEDQYDYVIIDSPPISFVTDAALLSSFADGTILVVASGQTDTRSAASAKEALEKVEANILGVVLTKIPLKGNGYYKYHYASLYAYQEEN
jgi:capsular exopolysaccharide synthesis family protein